MTNRILAAIDKMTDRIAHLAPDVTERMEAAATLGLSDRAKRGSAATLALAEGRFTPDEAITLHAIHANFAQRTLAERIVWMQAIVEAGRAA